MQTLTEKISAAGLDKRVGNFFHRLKEKILWIHRV